MRLGVREAEIEMTTGKRNAKCGKPAFLSEQEKPVLASADITRILFYRPTAD
jgi:phosphate starvation-inducible protein PhoH